MTTIFPAFLTLAVGLAVNFTKYPFYIFHFSPEYMESRSCGKALFVFKDNSFVFKDNSFVFKDK